MHRTQNLTVSAADTDTTPVVTPADILRGAATYLEAHGWNQRSYYEATTDPFPAACALGAIGMAAHGTRTDCPEIQGPGIREFNKAAEHLRWYLLNEGHVTLGPDQWGMPTEVGAWNDQDWHDIEHVTTALRAAADDYDWRHASDLDLETYADICAWREENPDRDGFLAWLAARR
jgi:hypothetical protein